MESERLADYLDLYQFSLGSLAYCVERMRATLREWDNEEAVALADEADRKNRAARRLQYDWELRKNTDPLERDGAAELDNRIDKMLSRILSTIENFAALGDGSEKGRLADELLEDLFPSGVYPITSKPFTDQHATINMLLGRLEDSYARHVDVLGLDPFVRRLAELNREFRTRLRPTRELLTYDEVESAFLEAQNAFHRLVVKVMGDYCRDFDKVQTVLEPVDQQTERTRRHLKRRGTIPEVDPESGEPVDEEGDSESPDDEPTN